MTDDPVNPAEVVSQAPETPVGRPDLADSSDSPPALPPSTPKAGDSSEGFLARLATAWKGFWQGWRGELLEIPEGEEGTIPLAHARALERSLEKKLERAVEAGEKLREEITGLQKQASEKDSELKDTQRELKRVRSASEESEQGLRDDLSKLQEKLGQREATAASLETDLAASKQALAEREQSLGEAQQQLRQARADAEATAGQLRVDLASREDSIAVLRTQMEQATAAHATLLASLKKELDAVREALANKEAASDMLLSEISNNESEAEAAREEAERAQTELKEEISRLDSQLKSSEQAKDKLRSELIAALPEKVAAADLRQKMSQAEKDFARKVEEADLLREDVRELRRRLAEYEGKLGGLEETEGLRAGLQRENQRQAAQLEAIRSQLEDSRVKADKLSQAVQEFHGPAISAIQVAGVYAETVAGSLALSESDRSDIVEIKQNVDNLRIALQKLSAKMAEIEAGRTNPTGE